MFSDMPSTSKGCPHKGWNNLEGWVGHALDPTGVLYDTLTEASIDTEDTSQAGDNSSLLGVHLLPSVAFLIIISFTYFKFSLIELLYCVTIQILRFDMLQKTIMNAKSFDRLSIICL